MDPFRAPYVFTDRQMTETFNRIPIMYGVIGNLGIFRGVGVNNPLIQIGEKDGKLYPIPSAPRGGTPHETALPRRRRRPFEIPHFPAAHTIHPGDVEGRISEISDDRLMALAEVRAEVELDLKARLDITKEWLRVNALQGILLDSDGSTIVNYFDEFEKTQEVIDFDFTTTTTDIASVANSVVSYIRTNLLGDTMTEVVAFVRSTFFDELIKHETVLQSYINWSAAEVLRRNGIPLDPALGGGRQFVHGSVRFVEYEGQITDPADGTTVRPFIPANEGIAIPLGTRNTFLEMWAPAPWWPTVNTRGQEFYLRQRWIDTAQDALRLEAQTNSLPMVGRPELCVSLTMS